MWCCLVVFIGDGKTMFCSILLDVACERPTFGLIWSFCKFSTLQSLKYSQVSSNISWALGIMNIVIMLWYSRIKMSFKVITTMSLLAFTWKWKAFSFVLPIQSNFEPSDQVVGLTCKCVKELFWNISTISMLVV